jgi:hypothetical protein
MVVFLRVIFDRPLNKRGRKRKVPDGAQPVAAPSLQPVKTIAAPTFKQYVSSIIWTYGGRNTSAAAAPAPATNGDSPSSPQMPEYKMSRGVCTVADAHREYAEGLFPRPSVKSLEEKYGSRWRKANTESQFYGRRLPLYRLIEKLIAEDKHAKEIFIPRLEALRSKCASLRKFCDRTKQLLRGETGTDLLVFFEQKIV